MANEQDDLARERRYTDAEANARENLEAYLVEQALDQLARCPRRDGKPPMSSYFCECAVCDPALWFGS